MPEYSEKKKAYNIRYQREKMKRIPLDVPLEPNKASELTYDMIKTAAAAAGEKVNEYIKNAVKARIAAEKANTGKTDPPEKS